MKLEDVKTNGDLEDFLRNVNSWNDDPYVYDVSLVISFFLASLDNLKKNLAGDIDGFGYYLTDPQREFLVELARHANMVTDKDIDEEDETERRKFQRYQDLRDQGATLQEVYLVAKADGLNLIACLQMLRAISGLGLTAVKEIAVVADGLANSLSEHQAKLIPAIEELLDEDDEDLDDVSPDHE